MSETENVEQGASGEAIDYSRPVGWWCPVCHMQWGAYPNTLISRHLHAIIPRYLPIPERVARLLAEREAKLTAARDALIAAHADDLRQGVAANAELRAMVERLKAQVSALHKDAAVVAVHREAERVQARTEANTLRARVAELEVSDAHLRKLLAEERGNVGAQSAQHLADIRALRTALASVCIDILTSPAVTDTMWSHRSGLSTTNDYIASVLGIDTVDEHGNPTAELARLAHYDDAKAAAPAVCRPDDNACGYCSMCKASTEGGEG